MMKRHIFSILLLTLCFFCVFSLTGCGIYGILDSILTSIQGEDSPSQTRERADALRAEYSETIIDCFKTGDSERLKGVFCAKTQGLADIDQQIAAGFDFLRGNITEYTVSPEMNGEGMGWDHGVVTLCEGYGDIYRVKTDAGRLYEISFHMYYVVHSEDRKGVTRITVRDTNNTNDINADINCYDDDAFFFIGYDWNESYYGDAYAFAYQAIKALSDGDLPALKATFCAESLAGAKLEAQLRTALGFFDGKALFGEPQNRGDIIYDGNRDFRITSVKDAVVLENGEEVSVYADVYTVNIETDTGKIYEMEWAGFLKNEKEPDSVGMIYFTLIDGDRSCQVGEKPTK